MWDQRKPEPSQAPNRNAAHTHRQSHTHTARLTDTLRDAHPQHKTPRLAHPGYIHPHTQPDSRKHSLSNTNTPSNTEKNRQEHTLRFRTHTPEEPDTRRALH